ncbi:DUF1839 family protein [Psychromicrobium lacuslunae]|uniref:DUF1839 family protein n=1 Tax=Psychromicrobium lacuslunae TaxID=1618207 RepID=UPI0006978AEF|nr:DUF1839 family protein [Psychromicrobium lacuslunae]
MNTPRQPQNPIAQLSELRPESFQPHPVHGAESDWSNTNCYLDVWVEVLNSLGLDPIPALASAFSAEFVGDQWEFLKVRSEDLELLYGIRFGEYDTWKPLREHLVTQLQAGNLAIVEVDAYYLPDTAGVSYHQQHSKTSITPIKLDLRAAELIYFHNGGLYQLANEDFEHTIGAAAETGFVPRPYLDLIRLDGLRQLQAADFQRAARTVLRAHLARRERSTQSDPMGLLVEYVQSQQETVAELGLEHFHQFSFATTRQAGLTAMFAAELARWFARTEKSAAGQQLLAEAANAFSECSGSAKKLQFQLARVAAGRHPDLQASGSTMQRSWQHGMRLVQQWDALDA